MKLWFKKISVVLITFMTLGVFIPPTYLDARAENEGFVSPSQDYNDNQSADVSEDDTNDYANEYDGDYDSTEYLINMITAQAKEQTLLKMGPKILERVSDDLTDTILPNIEEVLKMILDDAGEEKFQYYSIVEGASKGYGEKIFILYDQQSKQEVARFDVRRDLRPKEGHWFNFHYHLSEDNFEEHYIIGEVYWDKNTPPKWMS